MRVQVGLPCVLRQHADRNESSTDLDSLVSALVFAYMAQATSLSNRKYIAFYQQTSSLLHLRPENTYAFDQVSLSIAENLLLLNDISKEELAKGGFDVALIDHNRLDAIFGDAKVVSVLDHHEDEHLYQEAHPRVVQLLAGSCTSLVATFFKEDIDKLPAELAHLLLSSVIF